MGARTCFLLVFHTGPPVLQPIAQLGVIPPGIRFHKANPLFKFCALIAQIGQSLRQKLLAPPVFFYRLQISGRVFGGTASGIEGDTPVAKSFQC